MARPGRTEWGALAGVALLAVALRAPVADLPLERDEGEYAYIAARWLDSGELPYRDAFDQKPPGVFVLYALAFGVGGQTEAAVRWTAQAWTLVTLAAIAALGRRLFSPAAGVAAALLATLLTVDPSWLGNAVNTELVAIAPLSVGALAALRASTGGVGWSLLTGACGGLALLCKPVVAPIVAFELATAVWRSGRARAHAFAGAAGMAAVLAPVAVYFAAAGVWHELLDATVWNNLAYAGGTKLGDYRRYFWAQFRGSLVPLGPVYAVAAAAPLLLLSSGAGRARRSLVWVGAWLAASLAAVAAGGYFRQHYFVLTVPPLALLAGAALDGAARRLLPSTRAAAALAVAAALALVAHAVWRGWWYYGPASGAEKMGRLYGSNPFPEALPTARWIATHSAPDDRVFVYGSEPQLLFHAGRRSASRYIFVYPLTMPLGDAAARQREALAAFDAAPPRFVVGVFVRSSTLDQPGTPPELRQGLRERIERDYELAAVVPFTRDRRGSVVEGAAARTLVAESPPLWETPAAWTAYVVWERRPH